MAITLVNIEYKNLAFNERYLDLKENVYKKMRNC